MTIKKIALTTLSGSLAAFSGAVTANEINFAIDLESAYSDNANRLFNGIISERQDRLSLLVTGDYKNSWLTSDINYRITQLLFNKDSQDERAELEGFANFLFGAENGRFNVILNNSKRQVLGNAGEVDVADNRQTRDVTSVLPRLNIFRDQADTFSITGIYTAVNFDQNRSTQNSFDTTSTGAELAWQRRISKVDTVTLSVQHLDVDYDTLPTEDYQYQSVLVRYATSLRQLSYSVSAGYNTTEPDNGPENSAPQWEISVEYNNGASQITFLTESYLTDSSRGNQNSLLEEGNDRVALGNGATAVADQYNRKAHTITWTTPRLCTRCSLNLTASYSTERYNVETDQNNEELLASIRGGYRLSRQSELSLSYTYQEADFNDSSVFTSFDSDTFTLRYDKQLNENFDIRLRLSQTDRTGDIPANGFDETRVSAGFTYRFK